MISSSGCPSRGANSTSWSPIFQNRNRLTTYAGAFDTRPDAHDAVGSHASCALLNMNAPSGAPKSPDPGSNASPLPQSTVTWNEIAAVAPPAVGTDVNDQRSRCGGPGSGSNPPSGAGTAVSGR